MAITGGRGVTTGGRGATIVGRGAITGGHEAIADTAGTMTRAVATAASRTAILDARGRMSATVPTVVTVVVARGVARAATMPALTGNSALSNMVIE